MADNTITERTRRYRERVAQDGGKSIGVQLGPEANKALKAIMAKGNTQRQAIELALIAYKTKAPK